MNNLNNNHNIQMAQYNNAHTGGQGYNSSNNVAGNNIAHGISGNGSGGSGIGGGGGGVVSSNNSGHAGVNNHVYSSREYNAINSNAMNAMQGGIGKISDYDPITDGPRNIPNTTRPSSTLIYSSDRGGMGKP